MTSPEHGTDAERLVAAAVARLVDEIGPEALDDGDRLRALLLDELGDDAQRVRPRAPLVVDAAAEGVGSRLTHGPAVDLGRLSDEFADSMGLAAGRPGGRSRHFERLATSGGAASRTGAAEAPATLVFDPDSDAEPDAVPSAATTAPPAAPGEPGPTEAGRHRGHPGAGVCPTRRGITASPSGAPTPPVVAHSRARAARRRRRGHRARRHPERRLARHEDGGHAASERDVVDGRRHVHHAEARRHAGEDGGREAAQVLRAGGLRRQLRLGRTGSAGQRSERPHRLRRRPPRPQLLPFPRRRQS